jgi:hypothetical protein
MYDTQTYRYLYFVFGPVLANKEKMTYLCLPNHSQLITIFSEKKFRRLSCRVYNWCQTVLNGWHCLV